MPLLSVPQVLINDNVYKIVPNSFSYDGGELEINVRSASLGNGQTESVHTQNAEGAVSTVSFEVYPTFELDGDIATWKNNVGINEIKALQSSPNGDSFERVFPNMSLSARVTRDSGADTTVSLEWKGGQMILG